ncbi:YlbF family regulator [Roseburia inulinivorans]|uniref:YlbF family regulator n=1 Tax=Roseburia inulinivorans TaxID=360807 RepID=UPI0020938B97|nr:YlbF family regulator [Roseburia inulinivorans]
MSQIEDAMDGLMTAIRNSEEFIRYQAIKEKVHGFPKLESQITEFRKKNYLLQNSQGTVDLYEETDRMENEYREFRKILWCQSILQQKMHSAKLCSRSTGL